MRAILLALLALALAGCASMPKNPYPGPGVLHLKDWNTTLIRDSRASVRRACVDGTSRDDKAGNPLPFGAWACYKSDKREVWYVTLCDLEHELCHASGWPDEVCASVGCQ